MELLVQKYTMFLKHLLGEEEHYIGRQIHEVHQLQRISEEQFDTVLQALIEALDKTKVNFQVGCKIIQKIEKMRSLIVQKKDIEKSVPLENKLFSNDT